MSDTNITFLGAIGEVTGSATLVQSPRGRVLVDFGMIQGAADVDARNAALPEIDGATIDAVVLTHAHVDHCGRLPMLESMGFVGPVYCTIPTAELLGPILHGSARLQSILAFEHLRAQHTRVGTGVRRLTSHSSHALPLATPAEPIRLYTSADVDALLPRVQGLDYDVPTPIAPDIRLRFLDAGHVIGSASIELTIGHGASERVLVLSGDLGPAGAPLLRPLQSPERADVLVLESTYGDRSRPPAGNTLDALAKVVDTARRDRARLIIPTFTLGRAQQLLFHLGQLSRQGRLEMPVYLDSKMAVVASEIYAQHPKLLSDSVQRDLERGEWPLQFPELVYIHSRDDSKRLNQLRGAGIIIAGSGFCHGGPIVHHLAHSLWRPDAHVLLIGHQPAGTPAQQIAAGHPEVVIGDRTLRVGARIHRLPWLSGHADREGLLAYAAGIHERPDRIYLNHGDDSQRLPLAQRLSQDLNIPAITPAAMQPIVI